MSRSPVLAAERVSVADTVEAVNELFAERGWTDGLPVVPPTPDRVLRMLSCVDRDPQEVVAELAPAWAPATVEVIAINAVMAGCRPEYMPVLVTAIAALAAPELNFYGLQATTHPCGIFVLVNGPIAKELKINAWHGAFGPGFQANATIGRAIRLLQMNVGGAIPGTTDKATQGQPCKFSFCVAENEDENPWGPFHVERGFDAATSTVSVVGAEGPHNINDHISSRAEGILVTTADTMSIMGMNNAYIENDLFVAFGPEHAAILARDGLRKADIRNYLFEHARIPMGKWKGAGMFGMFKLPHHLNVNDDTSMVPIAASAEDIHIIVVGGAGRHSSFIPTFGMTRTVTRPIALRDGRPAKSVEDFRQSR